MIYVNGMPLEDYLRSMEMTDEDIISILEEGITKRLRLKQQALEKEKAKSSRPILGELALRIYEHYPTIPKELPCDVEQKTREDYVLSVYKDVIKRRKEGWRTSNQEDVIHAIQRWLLNHGIHSDIAYLICNVPAEQVEHKLTEMEKWRRKIYESGGIKISEKHAEHTLDRPMTRYLIRKAMQDMEKKEFCSQRIEQLHENAILAYILLDELF